MKKVMVGGVFSVLHPGHLYFLRKAKSLGDELVVVLASDRTVTESKGRLFIKAEERKENLEKKGIANKVLIGEYKGVYDIVKKEKPDIIVLGYDQEMGDEFNKWIKECGFKCNVIRIKEKHKDYSSSRIIEQKKKG
jgi:FAD synthetase